MEDTIKQLFLLPNFLGTKHPEAWLPIYFQHQLSNITGIICESYKSAELLISRTILDEKVELFLLNEHTQAKMGRLELDQFIDKHAYIGLLSDAGLPSIADPGGSAVAVAHKKGIKVVPLPGANSMILALAASGFNAQQFSFNGYLPIDNSKLNLELKSMINIASKKNISQIFMETPYRNVALFNQIIRIDASKEVGLCIAVNMLDKNEWIKSITLAEWLIFSKQNDMDMLLKKQPAVFVLGNFIA